MLFRCFFLVRRGVHPSFQGLYRQYPLSSKRLFRRLQNTCSQLAHWAPIFGEVNLYFVFDTGKEQINIVVLS